MTSAFGLRLCFLSLSMQLSVMCTVNTSILCVYSLSAARPSARDIYFWATMSTEGMSFAFRDQFGF